MSDRAGQRSMWAALVVPSAVCGMVLAPAGGWLGGPWAAATVFAVCLFDGILLGWIVERFRRDASAQLRRPELRADGRYQPGVFGPLLAEALLRIDELENRSAHAAQAKSELEARVHLGRRRQRQLAGTIDGLPDPVLLTDAAGRVAHANPAAWRLYHPGDSGSPKSNKADELKLDAVPAVAQIVRQILERPPAGSRTAEFASDGGEAPSHRATARPLHDEDGQLLGAAVQITDIRHEAEERRRHAEFVSNVCRELKTPMACIRSSAGLLRDGEFDTDDERAELCGLVEVQVDRLARLVDDLLGLARIQSGGVEVRREDCELNGVLQSAFESIRSLADAKDIRLVAEMSDLYLAVHADKNLLGQAAIHLLSNAVKYTPAGGEVRLRSRLDGDRAVIEVRDTGIGIPPESLPRLFERFYRVPRHNAAASGAGLGLALVKHVTTELHSGSISVQSEIDKGSAFTISLPFGHRDTPTRHDANRPVEATRRGRDE